MSEADSIYVLDTGSTEAYYNLGNKELALNNLEIAISINSNDERLKNNKKAIESNL